VHAAIGQTKAYSQLLNMSSMSPSDTACSNKFCLVSPGANYLVYLPSRGAVTVDLSATNQSLAAAWFDPATGETISDNSTSGGTQVRFTSPVGGQSVLQLLAEASFLARPTGTTNIESSSRSLTAANSTTTQSLTSSQSALQGDAVATPTITPNGGIYSGSVKVTLTTKTSGASIYYTTDGQTPTETSQKYKRAFTLTSSTLVKAIAVKNNMNPSAQASAWFSNSGGSASTVATPTITPNGGSFASSVSVTMASATSGASIHYTTDGSSPTQSSTPYAGPISLSNSTTLKAKAFKIGYDASAEASASFTKSSTSTVSSGLVAYWNFDEGNGTTAADSSGNGNHGTLVNGPQWASGVAGRALSFDGTDDSVDILNSNSLNLSNVFTLSAWVKPTAAFTDFRSILVKNYTYYFYASSTGYCGDGSIQAGFGEGDATTFVCDLVPLAANTWSHLVWSFDGFTLTLYRNGVAVATSSATGTPSLTTGTLQIGGSKYGEYFKGLIDEVRVYSRALSATEIQTIYQQTAVNLPFDYAISNSGDRSANAGSSVNNSITATLVSGSTQSVSFSVSGLPSGATASFSPASCTLSCSTVLSIGTSGPTPAGNYPITVTAAGGGLKRSTFFTLSITFALTVSTPTITPNGGTFSTSVSVALQSATSGSSIYYTTDGSAPTQSSVLYTGAMTLTSNATVKAVAFKSGYNPSTIAAASFTNSLTSPTGTGKIYYVSTFGSDSNSCATAASTAAATDQTKAKRNIMGASGGISCLSPGDTLDIRSGTYNEKIISYGTPLIPNGTAGSYVTIRGHAGETVTIPMIAFSSGSGRQYIAFDNLVIDGNLVSDINNNGIYIGAGVNHIRVSNSEIKNAGAHGVQAGANSSFLTIFNVAIHDNGLRPYVGSHGGGYGMYIEGSNNLFEQIRVYNNVGYGIHIYSSGSSSVNNNTVRDSTIYNNGGFESTQFGIILSCGSGNAAYNNSIYNNTAGVQIDYGCTNCVVSGNRIYGNNEQGYAAIVIGSSATGTVVSGNTISQSIGTITDNGTGTIISN
jgi:hypothetical protein